MAKPLLNASERRTHASLLRALADTDRSVSCQPRTLDVLRAAAPGPFDGREREAAISGLERGDIAFAYKSSFDFVVLDRNTTPLLAVEFDGPSHLTRDGVRRDACKNRLCLVAGLPLLRVDDRTLTTYEQTELVEWVVSLWIAYLREMPQLEHDRAREISALSSTELHGEGAYLLCDRPDLDVDFVFRLAHPFPPAMKVARRLHAARRLHLSDYADLLRFDDCSGDCRGLHADVLPDLAAPTTLVAYESRVHIAGELAGVGRYEATSTYPLHEPASRSSPEHDAWAELVGGLPAGPWFGAPHHLARGMAVYNALLDTERRLEAA